MAVQELTNKVFCFGASVVGDTNNYVHLRPRRRKLGKLLLMVTKKMKHGESGS